MRAAVTGWIAIGLKAAGSLYGMADLDVYVGYVSNGVGLVTDGNVRVNYLRPDDECYSQYGNPSNDAFSGICSASLLRAQEAGGKTTIQFERLMNTLDVGYDFKLQADQPFDLYYAYHATSDNYFGSDQHTQNTLLLSSAVLRNSSVSCGSSTAQFTITLTNVDTGVLSASQAGALATQAAASSLNTAYACVTLSGSTSQRRRSLQTVVVTIQVAFPSSSTTSAILSVLNSTSFLQSLQVLSPAFSQTVVVVTILPPTSLSSIATAPSITIQTTIAGYAFSVGWSINAINRSITFTLQSTTKGWMAIGISNNVLMYPADVAYGYVTSGGLLLFNDMWAFDYSPPVLDSLLGGSDDFYGKIANYSNGIQTITFSRSLAGSNPIGQKSRTDYDIQDQTYSLNLAVADNTASFTNSFYHSGTKTYCVNLIQMKSYGECNEAWRSPALILVVIVFGFTVLVFLYRCATQRKQGFNSRSRRTNGKVSDNSNWILGEKPADKYVDSVLSESDFSQPNPSKQSYLDIAPVNEILSSSSVDMVAADQKTSPPHFVFSMTSRIPVVDISVAQGCLYVAYILLNLLLALVSGYYQLSVGIAINWGYLTMGNVLVAIIFATRNSIIRVLTGLAVDQAISYHQMIGYVVFACATIHMAMMWSKPIDTELGSIGNTWTITKFKYGFLAWCCLVVSTFLSISYIRRAVFELFITSHMVFVVFLAAAYLHTKTFLPYLVTAAVFYGGDKLIRCVWGLLPKKTTSVDVSVDGIVRLRFPKNQIAKALKQYQAGQYIFLNVPSLSLLQWHPFSLTSNPESGDDEICVRSLGNFTKQLGTLAKEQGSESFYVRVDGPYGNPPNPRMYPGVLLFAGGIGITPVIGLLRSIYHLSLDASPEDANTSLGLVKSVRPTSNFNSEKPFVCVSWNVSRLSDFQLFAQVFAAAAAACEKDASLPAFYLTVTLSTRAVGKVSSALPACFKKGRTRGDPLVLLNAARIPTLVFVCGPLQMTNDVWDFAMVAKSNGRNLDVHREGFAL